MVTSDGECDESKETLVTDLPLVGLNVVCTSPSPSCVMLASIKVTVTLAENDSGILGRGGAGTGAA